MSTIAQLLAQSGLPPLEARMLLERVLGKTRAWLIAHADEAAGADAERAFAALVERRGKGEPIAYILGEREFYGLELHVTPAVLIPRPETELLVELALARMPANARHARARPGDGQRRDRRGRWRSSGRRRG